MDPKVPPRQLPPTTASFTGRSADLRALDHALGTGMAVIHGPGGVGKTALALRWAHRVAGLYQDGQIFLDMRGFGPDQPVEVGAALDLVLRAVGVPPAQVPAGTMERSALLRATLAGRRVLLFLDNVRDAGQVWPLQLGPDALLVVTSRTELSGLIVEALHHQVRELPLGEAVALLRTVVGPAASAAELAELAELCGRFPLALMIAAERAGRLPDWPVADTLAELRAARHRLDALGDSDDPAADLRTVFSWSYQALDPATARAFRCLGSHPAPEITLPVAAAMLGETPKTAAGLLAELVATHLAQRAGPDRVRCHDLLWAFATEQAAGEPPEVRERMLDWYLRTLHRARFVAFSVRLFDLPDPVHEQVRPRDFADVSETMQWYDEEHDTLVAVVADAVAHGHDRHAWQLASLVRDFQEALHHGEQQLRMAELAVRAADRLGGRSDRAYAYNLMATARYFLGRHEQACDWHQQACELAKTDRNDGLTSTILSAWGLALLGLGDTAAAAERMAESVEFARRVQAERPMRLGHSLLNLAEAEAALGRHADAMAHNQQALAIYRAHGTEYHQGLALGNLTQDYLELGQLDQALDASDQALRVLANVADSHVVPNALIARGKALFATGDLPGARQAWDQAHRTLQPSADHRLAEVTALLAGLRPAGADGI